MRQLVDQVFFLLFFPNSIFSANFFSCYCFGKLFCAKNGGKKTTSQQASRRRT